MTRPRIVLLALLLVVGVFTVAEPVQALDFKLAIMQDKKGAAAKYRPLLEYFKRNGINASFIATRSYRHAADLFAGGDIDGMFSGSGVAGTMMIMDLARPLVRPVHSDGWSTYWAVVLAPKGSPRFTQDAAYFQDKRVMYCSLASSGEFFYQAIRSGQDLRATLHHASSHGAAVDALARGRADVAIVKNRVWDGVRDKYKDVVRVGEDPGENPNGTLIIANRSDPAVAKKVSAVLLALGSDPSTEAMAVKTSLKVTRYVETTVDDFRSTLDLLRRAGVDARFSFRFE